MRSTLTATALALVLAAPGIALAQQAQPTPPAGAAPPAPEVQVQQPAPNIQVQQPEPTIKVEQPPPQVTVQQPPPNVTIEQPPPQVTVEQAKPEVNVQQAQPKVEVQPQGQPNVQVQQPAQPEVTVTQPGQPQGQQPSATAAAGGDQWYSSLRGEEIVGQTLYGANGEEIGEVNNLVAKQGGTTPDLLVGVGGFLGIGERDVAIPLNEVQMGPDNRLTTGMTKEQINAMQPYDKNSYQDWDRSRPLGGS
jgi:hypothetical protein